MFGNVWRWLNDWWVNTKPVLLSWVFPKLDAYKPQIAAYLRLRRQEIIDLLNREDVDGIADEIVEGVKTYLKKQL